VSATTFSMFLVYWHSLVLFPWPGFQRMSITCNSRRHSSSSNDARAEEMVPSPRFEKPRAHSPRVISDNESERTSPARPSPESISPNDLAASASSGNETQTEHESDVEYVSPIDPSPDLTPFRLDRVKSTNLIPNPHRSHQRSVRCMSSPHSVQAAKISRQRRSQ
jgi:hypothetical protein